MKIPDLTEKHCEDVLSKSILIGAKKGYRFMFNPLDNQYQIWDKQAIIREGLDLDLMLAEYNDL